MRACFIFGLAVLAVVYYASRVVSFYYWARRAAKRCYLAYRRLASCKVNIILVYNIFCLKFYSVTRWQYFCRRPGVRRLIVPTQGDQRLSAVRQPPAGAPVRKNDTREKRTSEYYRRLSSFFFHHVLGVFIFHPNAHFHCGIGLCFTSRGPARRVICVSLR